MVNLTEIVYRRLLLSKQFYKHGVSHSENKTSIDRCLSIHHFQLSVDIVLNSIIDLNCVITDRNPRQLGFGEKINKINSHFKDKNIRIPYGNNILNLNDLRNSVQHDATSPDYDTVIEYLKFTELFLRESFKLFFWQDFETISEVSLIEDTTLRHSIERIGKLIENQDYQKSVDLISAVYLLSSDSIGKNIDFSPTEVYENDNFHLDMHGIRTGVSSSGTYKKVTRDHEKVLFLLEVGVTSANYEKFISIIPYSSFSMAGGIICVKSDHSLSREQALWCLEFLTQIVLKWQNQGLIPRILEKDKLPL